MLCSWTTALRIFASLAALLRLSLAGATSPLWAPPSNVIHVTDATASQIPSSLPQTEWIVFFYADWCHACSSFKPAFNGFALHAMESLPALRVAMVDASSNPGLLTRFGITSLPAIIQ